MELQDQRVLVTGATAGIGQEAAKLFARRGVSVVITGRDTERGAQTVAAIEAEGGTRRVHRRRPERHRIRATPGRTDRWGRRAGQQRGTGHSRSDIGAGR